MKVLWIVNTIFPYPAERIGIKKSCFGGWLNGLSDSIIKNKEIKLAIATVYNGKEILEFDDGEILYYLIPGAPALKYNKNMEEYWKRVNNMFKPDIVHIHGTEFAHGLAYINTNISNKVVVSIQGLVYRYADVYLGNISKENIYKNITFRDVLKRDNLFKQKKKFEERGKNEIDIIKKANAIIGRTTWDYANVKAINPRIKYFTGNETLRSNFYNKEWKIDKIDRYTVFCSQASYPIKGFHYLLQAISILKYRYPKIKLYVGGTKILNKSNIKTKLKSSGYSKYIQRLIKQYNLEENIFFTGMLDEEQMLNRLLKSHVFVLPSAIENSSNSLGEAMLLGMPCVASNTGGTMDMLEHKKEGYLYPYTEPAMCAEYISRLFDDDSLSVKLGMQAQITAKERHNSEKNAAKIMDIYNDIINKE